MRTKTNAKFLVEYRIDELEESLDPELYFRVNRALFVSIDAIEQVHIYPGNRLKLHLKPAFEKEVIVSRDRVFEFRVWLGG
jgi:DNA-binding LytR/AlgR family response regulator